MTKQTTKLYAAISPDFGPRFAFNAKNVEQATSLIKAWNRYHSFNDVTTAHTVEEIDSLEGLTISIHNEYVN